MGKQQKTEGRGWVIAQNALTLVTLGLGPMLRSESWHLSLFVLGALLFIAGAIFGILGVRDLGQNRTPYPKPLEESQLVQTGIYSLIRHPLYSSLIFASIGWSLLWSSWPALVSSLGLTLLLNAKANVEERWLRQIFPEYAAYTQRVRRFVPGIL